MPAAPAALSSEDGLLEHAVFGVLAVHRHLPQYIANQRRHLWQEMSFTPTAKRRLAVIGQGVVADEARRQLEALGFPVLAGDAAQCDMLLCVSPGDISPAACRDIFGGLAAEASVVIVGEAGDALLGALRGALARGRVMAAYLALAGSRLLGQDDALWPHPHVMLAPLA
jgi:glyoxylate/hydroxypyruvate reductase A